jgi:hypothetical protein
MLDLLRESSLKVLQLFDFMSDSIHSLGFCIDDWITDDVVKSEWKIAKDDNKRLSERMFRDIVRYLLVVLAVPECCTTTR